jgi:tetratricopeptide (TPR) repeat protein
MRRVLLATALIVLLGLVGACSKQAQEEPVDPVEAAWTAMVETYNELENPEDKAELFEAFLREHPDTPQAGRLASSVAYFRGEELDDPAAAYAILSETRAKNTHPEARFRIGMAMFPLSMELGTPTDLDAVAQEYAASETLDFGDLIDVANLAVEHEAWTVGATYAEAALEKATPEAFLADYPDDDYTAEEATAKADRRKAMSYAGLGWSLWNLGDTDKATAAFDEAAEYKTVNYVGAADTPVDIYRGKALLASGDAEGAIELLTPAAVLASDEDAAEALREAFAATGRNEAEFNDFVWSERLRLARTIDDFTLTDYDGASHDFSALSDGRVTLLAFWFPT